MADLSARQVARIEGLVTDWLSDNDVPGLSVVIVDADGERYAEGFGARDVESNAPATPATLYGMGSITKSVTALAIVQLAEAGDLSVDDPVDEYVDHYADTPGDPITIYDLLTHTSGMPSTSPGLLEQALEGFPAGVSDQRDRERFVRASTEYRTTGGDRFFYYNTGYNVLGEVIETVDGRGYSEYVEEEIFEPLGMHRSTFDGERLDEMEDAMTGYRPGGEDEPPEPSPFPIDELERPSGGLIASVRELSRFLRAMMTDGTLDGERVCSAESVEQLQQGRTVRQTFLDGTDQQYGFGWMREPLGDDEVVGHGGSILVSTAYAGHLAETRSGVVLACNSTGAPHAGELGQAVLAIANGGDETAVPAFALEQKCEAVTGTYEAFREEYRVDVERAGGGLSLTLEGDVVSDQFQAFPVTLDPDDHEFYTVTGAGARLPVEFDLEGEHDDLYYSRARFRRS